MTLDLSKPKAERTLTKRNDDAPQCYYPDVVVEIILPIQRSNSFEIVGKAQDQMRRAGLPTHMIGEMLGDLLDARSQYEMVKRLEHWITVRYWNMSLTEATHVTEDQTPTECSLTPAERPTPTYRWQAAGDTGRAGAPACGGTRR